jgi:hypothetical protein
MGEGTAQNQRNIEILVRLCSQDIGFGILDWSRFGLWSVCVLKIWVVS